MIKSPNDPIIHVLAKKKKALLSQLLAISIQSAIDERSVDTDTPDREQLMAALSTNDKALESRENDLGVKASRQQAGIFREIGSILNAIKDNNTQVIDKLEKEMRLIERERSRLNRGNKLSGYITQQNRYPNGMSAGMPPADRQPGSRLLDGTL